MGQRFRPNRRSSLFSREFHDRRIRISSMGGLAVGFRSTPTSSGRYESNLASSGLNLSEHMKNRHRQKMMSTIATTLIATGFSS